MLSKGTSVLIVDSDNNTRVALTRIFEKCQIVTKLRKQSVSVQTLWSINLKRRMKTFSVDGLKLAKRFK